MTTESTYSVRNVYLNEYLVLAHWLHSTTTDHVSEFLSARGSSCVATQLFVSNFPKFSMQ